MWGGGSPFINALPAETKINKKEWIYNVDYAGADWSSGKAGSAVKHLGSREGALII